MFIGGTFTTVADHVKPDPTPATNSVTGLTGLAAIDMSTGEAISTFTPQLAPDSAQTFSVLALAVVGNRLYVGGRFSTVDGENHYNLAAIDIDPTTIAGTVASDFNPVVGIPGSTTENKFEVDVILPGPDGLYIGGAFSKVDGVGRPKTAKLNWDGTLIKSYKTPGVNGIVHDMAFSTDGASIFLAGGFTQLGTGNTRYSIGRVDAATGATLPWAVPASDIPGATTTGQICYELAVTSTRVFAGCGKKPNFVGGFRLDNGNTGNKTWQYGMGGNVQTIALLSNGTDLAIGGHFGINSTSTYNGLMPVCRNSVGGTKYLRAMGVLRNVVTPLSGSPITDGGTSTTQPYLDCNFVPNVDGLDNGGDSYPGNYKGTNPHGGSWEIQVTSDHLWFLGEFEYINNNVRRAIARFALP
jgi:hypothetical protein